MVAEAVGKKNENGQSYFSVGYLPGARQADIEAPRRETPKWMFNDGKFREFLQSRGNRRIERWDCIILAAYYFYRKSDEEIFRGYEVELHTERTREKGGNEGSVGRAA